MDDGGGSGAADGGEDLLPTWSLRDLYDDPRSPVIDADLAWADGEADAVQAAYAGKLSGLSGADLGRAIARYEALSERLNRVMSYAQLRFAEDMSDPERGRALQTLQERVTAISVKTLFFTLELNLIDVQALERQLTDAAARRYAPWIRDSRVFRPHQLSDDMETLLLEKSVAGRRAWIHSRHNVPERGTRADWPGCAAHDPPLPSEFF